MDRELLYGINNISSLLTTNSGKRKIYEIIINKNRKNSPRVKEIINKADKRNIIVKELDSKNFLSFIKDKFTEEEIVTTQGVLAKVSSYNFYNLEQILETYSDKKRLFVVLDEITDIGNFASILRNCSAFGVDGVIISKNRSVDINRRVSKISAGALEEIKIFRVVNIVKAIENLKKRGFWIYGTTLEIGSSVKLADEIEYSFPVAIVFGSEGKGIGRLVAKSCDFMVRINMPGNMQSLNVSTAVGIMLYIIKNFQMKKVI